MNGDSKHALRDLYDENIDALYRYVYFKMQSHEEDVLDVIQEAFYKIGIELWWGKKIDNLKAYLYRIVSNKIIDFYRKNKPISLEQQIDDFGDVFQDETDVENIAHAKLEVEKVYHILAGLTSFEKDIFLLRFVEGFSPKDIAQRFDTDVNSVTVRLHRLKEKVKWELEDI